MKRRVASSRTLCQAPLSVSSALPADAHERTEDIDPVALAEGIQWDFETFPEYLDAVDGCRRASTSPPTSGTPRCARGRWANARSPRGKRRRPEAHARRSSKTHCAPALSASRPRAASITRPRTTGRLRRASCRGTKSSHLVHRMGELGAGHLRRRRRRHVVTRSRHRARSLQRMTDLAVEQPGTDDIRFRRDPCRGPAARFPRRRGCGRRAGHRADALPRHLGSAVVQDAGAVRPVARAGSEFRALPEAAQLEALRDPAHRRARRRRHERRLRRSTRAWARRRVRPTSKAFGSTGRVCRPIPRSPTLRANEASIRPRR